MTNDLFKNGIFVIHALQGYEFHEKRIIQLFKKNNLSFQFVTEGDPSLFTQEIIDTYFTENIHTILSKGTLSCTLNHIYAYEKIVQNQIQYAIIFENDPYFLGNFTQDITSYFAEIEKLPKGFILSLENGTLRFPSYWQSKKNQHLYEAKSGRNAGAYLIDLEGAKKILEDLKTNKCHTVIDWWHNSLIERGVLKMYWAHPALVEQGSHNGMLHSTISTKPSNLKRRISWNIQKFYKSYIKRFFDEKNIV